MSEAISNQMAEIIGAVLESISALSAVSRQQHLVHLHRHSRDEAEPSTETFAFFEGEREKAESDLKRSNADLLLGLRKLEAIKLILEGKPADEIRAKFADGDAAVTEFIERLEGRKSGTALVPAGR